MTAQDRATMRDADQLERRGAPCAPSSGAMALQSGPSYEAHPQAFVRLTGSLLAKPRAGRVTATE